MKEKEKQLRVSVKRRYSLSLSLRVAVIQILLLRVAGGRGMDFNHCSVIDVASMPIDDYISSARMAMASRFSSFVVTPEQQWAWEVGFRWIHQFASEHAKTSPNWQIMPEYSAPLVSGRPDLVIDTGSHLLVVEMKTGVKGAKSLGEKQVLEYADTIWGKLKLGRYRFVIPILLTQKTKSLTKKENLVQGKGNPPDEIIKVGISGLNELCQNIYRDFEVARDFSGGNKELLKYSPRPSVVEAAVALVAALNDRNVITGLSDTAELSRLISKVKDAITNASKKSLKQVIVVSGAPGAGKTLVGLRIAHDRSIQELLGENFGTPLYLTGNGPLVEVLVESLARDEVNRIGTSKSVSISHANSKVRGIHAITEGRLGIESNVIVFDEGQRVWTEDHMQKKGKGPQVKSEAEEILKYLEKLPWAVAVVLLGEGQEINSGEEGIETWAKAVVNRNLINSETWSLTTPHPLHTGVQGQDGFKTDSDLQLKTNQRTDNAADVSGWVEQFLQSNFEEAREMREKFKDFPIFITRDLVVAKAWLSASAAQDLSRAGLVASSRSKRLVTYGVDAVAEASRSFNWAGWYLNNLPNLNSSSALEVAATEYKCQGLELDWVGVCWSWDMVFVSGEWQARTLDAAKAKWKTTKSMTKFQINAYRVLLTRSRKGLIIWIPEGDDKDPSRNRSEMDLVAKKFLESGAKQI